VPAKLLKWRGFAGIRAFDELGCEMASTGGKSVILTNSDGGNVSNPRHKIGYTALRYTL
jgi:hypothetical protein